MPHIVIQKNVPEKMSATRLCKWWNRKVGVLSSFPGKLKGRCWDLAFAKEGEARSKVTCPELISCISNSLEFLPKRHSPLLP
jgi:hypothetical protein